MSDTSITDLSYEEVVKRVKKLVVNTSNKDNACIVFDIDGTLLTDSNVSFKYKDPKDVFKWQYKGCFAPIKPIVDLYIWCRKQGVMTCIITGRKESLRGPTIKNLLDVGINEWDWIFFKPLSRGKSSVSTEQFKIQCRKKLSDECVDIIANIGDQETDLIGGYADNIYKLPSSY